MYVELASLRPSTEPFERIGRFGYLNAAMSLAEKDRDFASLVALCHRDTVYPPEANPHAIRIQQYIENYKADFTVPLFQWYIQHGKLDTCASAYYAFDNEFQGNFG